MHSFSLSLIVGLTYRCRIYYCECLFSVYFHILLIPSMHNFPKEHNNKYRKSGENCYSLLLLNVDTEVEPAH